MTSRVELRLVVDGSKCDAHGICALVMPELISLDTWGYATLASGALVDASSVARARRVVRACPAGALTLVGDPRSAPSRPAVVRGGARRGRRQPSASQLGTSVENEREL